MKLLNYFVTKRLGSAIVMVLIVLLQTTGLPTNIGGPWHLTTPWSIDAHWIWLAISCSTLNGALIFLYFHVKQEFNRVQK